MTRWTLPPERIPPAWFNVAPHLTTPLQPPLHPATREPVGPDDLAPLFPAALVEAVRAVVDTTTCTAGYPTRAADPEAVRR